MDIARVSTASLISLTRTYKRKLVKFEMTSPLLLIVVFCLSSVSPSMCLSYTHTHRETKVFQELSVPRGQWVVQGRMVTPDRWDQR